MSRDSIYSIADLKDTFIYRTTDMSDISLRDFSKHFINEESFTRKESVETIAYAFYFMEHALSEVEKRYAFEQELPDGMKEVVKESLSVYETIFTLCFSYVFSIVSRESRHLFNQTSDFSTLDASDIDLESRLAVSGRTLFGKKTIKDCLYLTSSIACCSSKDLKRGGFKANKKAPDITISTYLEYLQFIFNNADWEEGYGGIMWANITETLHNLIKGEISPKIFIDTVWSLEHNNGCIFNKDTVFREPSGDSTLYFILQAQAAGIIPYMVNQEDYKFIDPRLESSYKNFDSSSCGEKFANSFKVVEAFFPKMFAFNMSEYDFTEILEY